MARALVAGAAGAALALLSVTSAVADWLQDFSVWPEQQTKNAYFYLTEYCYPYHSKIYYRFFGDVGVMGYAGGVTIQTFSVYGGYQINAPTIYYVSAMTWAPWQGSWGGTIYPFIPISSGSFVRYPGQYYSISASLPAYVEVVVADANVSVGCRWTNYVRLFPQ